MIEINLVKQVIYYFININEFGALKYCRGEWGINIQIHVVILKASDNYKNCAHLKA